MRSSSRNRSRSRSRHAHGGSPIGAALGALVLAGAAAFAAGSSASAQPAPLEWIRNGDFGSPLPHGWSCDGDVVQLARGVEGRPGSHDYAGCFQKVAVVAGTSYDFSAYVSGAYAFVRITGTGTGTGEVQLWADGAADWTGLRANVAIGNSHEVTVHFHGWYGQGPYRISRISLIGPMYPDPCATATPGPSGTPTCLPRPVAPSGGPEAPTGA
ncbi:hypothetical protein PUR61_08275 [Streptomyces sp. BE20]|uniref:hypothetical protein n=1 Tax=unclassified Streptomyces TaxID=2593676 RepID=UPI002E7A0BE6|nr:MULTISPECIES: hypothetical protein [unclassified Streptomyces]MED7951126.1 hypothetical protein [Streptomyces sp. BE303]MEE1822190.1 hypothetical protein [Streptomyces sp. BE20]